MYTYTINVYKYTHSHTHCGEIKSIKNFFELQHTPTTATTIQQLKHREKNADKM